MTRSLIKTAELPIATGTSASPTCAQDAKRQTAGIFLASSWRPAAGTSGPALLAHILVARYRDQLPLDRQGEIFARMGADIPGATLIDWCGQAAGALRPLVDLIRDVVVASDRIHAEGEARHATGSSAVPNPILVLDPRKKRPEGVARGVKEGRIWVYVKDDRPWAGSDPPAAACWFAPDHKGEHTRAHLADFDGILQADAYAGFKDLYEPGADGTARVREGCLLGTSAARSPPRSNRWRAGGSLHDVVKATDSLSRARRWRGSARSTTSRPPSRPAARCAPRRAPEAEPAESRGLPPGSPAGAISPRPCATR